MGPDDGLAGHDGGAPWQRPGALARSTTEHRAGAVNERLDGLVHPAR
jgi:hypothetical protein